MVRVFMLYEEKPIRPVRAARGALPQGPGGRSGTARPRRTEASRSVCTTPSGNSRTWTPSSRPRGRTSSWRPARREEEMGERLRHLGEAEHSHHRTAVARRARLREDRLRRSRRGRRSRSTGRTSSTRSTSRCCASFARACEDASWDDEIRVVVLTGKGRAFLRRRGSAQLGGGVRRQADRVLEVVRRLQGRSRPAAETEAHAGADQRDRGRRRQRAADGLRPRRHGGRRVHPPCRAGARVGAGWGATQWLAIMVGDRRRARDRSCARRSRPACRGVGARELGGSAEELDAKTDEVVENLARKLPQTTRYASST